MPLIFGIAGKIIPVNLLLHVIQTSPLKLLTQSRKEEAVIKVIVPCDDYFYDFVVMGMKCFHNFSTLVFMPIFVCGVINFGHCVARN